MATSRITQSYMTLKGINLGTAFLKDNGLTPGQKYPITVTGLADYDLSGTLQRSGFIGGLAAMYERYPGLKPDEEVKVSFVSPVIKVTPPGTPSPIPAVEIVKDGTTTEPPWKKDYVFERRSLRHLQVEPFAPGNLRNWSPQGEPDVYMVFGELSEYTEYRYCCGTSADLLRRLGYIVTEQDKPDAILIERATGQYLIASAQD